MAKIGGFSGEYQGLSQEEAARRLERAGANELNPLKRKGLVGRMLKTFTEPMFLLLFAAAAIYFFLKQYSDGAIMLTFVGAIAAIELVQEYKTDKTLDALKELSAPRVNLVREGRLVPTESRLVVPGDLMVVEEGEKISADGRVLEQFDLGVDQSALTGESDVIYKTAAPGGAGAQFRENCVYQGTMVISGSAIVEVTATGRSTQSGQIGLDVAEAPERPTPLEKQVKGLVKTCAMAGGVMLVLVYLATLLGSGSHVDSLLAGITLAMGIIPEEFPVILTVFLSLGALRLARRSALVRRLPSVETLGAVSVLCVDKTGTLTENNMRVKSGYLKIDEAAFWHTARRACEITPYDPMERAIVDRAGPEELEDDGELVFEYSFSSERKMMGHIWRKDGACTLCAKGSPEGILPLCGLDEAELKHMGRHQNELADRGERVIAVAMAELGSLSEFPAELTDNPLRFVGFIGFSDPPRPEVAEAVAACRGAGVRMVMITGDNPNTALSIARQVGIPCERAVTGDQLEAFTPQELAAAVAGSNVFARVAPRHKMAIVSALKAQGEVVAMTGDGVNDAPALKYSDIGIAMGERGTNVAREAADMVLLDDNLTTIVHTIGDGRRIYDNIRKAIGYVFVVHVPIALLALMVPVAGLLSPGTEIPMMLLPIHIVILELIIDPVCSVIFERQPPETDLMTRPPRSPSAPLVSRALVLRSAFQGVAVFAASFAGYLLELAAGAPEGEARGFALAVLVLSNLLLVYINMSDTRSARGVFGYFMKDRVMWVVNCAITLGLLAILYVPPLAELARVAPLPLPRLALAAALAFGCTMWYELLKARRIGNRRV